MADNPRSPKFLRAADTLLPLLQTIPRPAVKRWNLKYEDIINQCMEIQEELPGTPIYEILATDLPFYINHGVSKVEYEMRVK